MKPRWIWIPARSTKSAHDVGAICHRLDEVSTPKNHDLFGRACWIWHLQVSITRIENTFCFEQDSFGKSGESCLFCCGRDILDIGCYIQPPEIIIICLVHQVILGQDKSLRPTLKIRIGHYFPLQDVEGKMLPSTIVQTCLWLLVDRGYGDIKSLRHSARCSLPETISCLCNFMVVLWPTHSVKSFWSDQFECKLESDHSLHSYPDNPRRIRIWMKSHYVYI